MRISDWSSDVCSSDLARATSERQEAKYLNSPAADHFDKGRLLFNLHRAAPAARTAQRLVLVEGYFDVIALDSVGIVETVAPMGAALTAEQIARSEERGVGKECVSTCRSRWSPDH